MRRQAGSQWARIALVVVLAAAGGGSTAPAGADPATGGYWLAGADGTVRAFGGAAAHGSQPAGTHAGVVGLAATPAGDGYWLVARDGGVFAFGGAGFFGSLGDRPLNRPVVAMAATPSGRGYWLVASDGGVFSFGDAGFWGSTGDRRLNAPIVGAAATPSGGGYWLVAADGGIFAFGDARFHGSTGDRMLNRPVVGMAATPSGRGYWLVASDGGVFSFGDAGFWGSTGDRPLNAPITGIAGAPAGRGYWLLASDGGVFSFGDASFLGSAAGDAPAGPVVAMAAVVREAPAAPGVPGDEGPALMTQLGAGGAGAAFAVGLVGDTGYTADQAEDFLRVRGQMNRAGLAFSIHDGDIWSGTTPCDDGRYLSVRSVFDGFEHPVVYTPGDNEWADCDDPDGRLDHLRDVFFSTDMSLGQPPLPLIRQAAPYVENVRWSRSGVVFATLNVPGPDGRAGSDSGARLAANVAWLNAAFNQAAAAGSPAVVVAWQDNPFVPDTSGDELLRTLRRRAADFGRPVVLVHGDTHRFRIDRPWSDVPHFTRVETFAADESNQWVRMRVDPAARGVFSFDEMSA